MASASLNVEIRVNDRNLRRLLDGNRFRNKFNQQMSRQFLSIGERAKRDIRQTMERGEGYAKLGVWRYIKDSEKVLIHTGALRDGFTFKYIRQSQGAVIGIRILPTGTHAPSGLPMAQIASMLHNGAEFVPTLAQRQALAIKAREAGAPAPTGPPQKIWRIPPRPFMRDAILNDNMIGYVMKRANTALRRTIRELQRS